MNTKQLSVVGALTLILNKEHATPIVSSYDIGIATLRLYKAKEYAGQKIKRITSELPKRSNISRYKNELLENGILEERRELPKDVFLLVTYPHQEAEDLACGINPFCYVSHLSAMSYHGLTDRFPKTLFLTSPTPNVWRERVREKMEKDLGSDYEQYMKARFPIIMRHSITTLNRNPVEDHTTKNADAGAYIKVSGRPIRVTSIGRTFLDMLRKPELCGGMSHVVSIYENVAKNYLKLIVNEIERHGEPIEKVRAGYILEERCKLDEPKIDGWLKFAQRGGSRVLDPGKPYRSEFSEKWCLSLNIF